MDRFIRSTVLERDDLTCQSCGRCPASQVHHIQSRRQGGSDCFDNLITLCGRCHMIISPVPPFALRRAFNISLIDIKGEQARVHNAIQNWQKGYTTEK